jgi:ABC-2 type transport system permease protein
MTLRSQIETVRALMRRGLNEILRVPGAAIPGVLAPTIFFLGLTAVFGNLTDLTGFPIDSYASWLVPVSLMQAAGFTGAATGVNLARDIEQGWFDRLLASPASRFSLLAGLVLSASFRVLIPATFLLIVAFSVGAHFPGVDGLLLAILIVMGVAVVASGWGVALALRFRTQSAAPLMQAGMLTAVLCTTAYAPLELLNGWLQEVARYNPVTQILDAARQGFIGGVTWGETWPGLLVLFALAVLLTAVALRGMRRATY